MRSLTLASLLLSAFAFTGLANAAEDVATPKAKPYTLETCAVSGEKLGGMGDAVVKEYKGQEVKFCCGGCVKKFEKDVDGNLKKVTVAMDKAAADKAAAGKPDASKDSSKEKAPAHADEKPAHKM